MPASDRPFPIAGAAGASIPTRVRLRRTAACAAPILPARSSSPITTPATAPKATSRTLPRGHPGATAAGPPRSHPPGRPFAVALPLPQSRRPAVAGSRSEAQMGRCRGGQDTHSATAHALAERLLAVHGTARRRVAGRRAKL